MQPAVEAVQTVAQNVGSVLGATRQVRTGDESRSLVYGGVALGSLVGLGGWGIAYAKRKKKEEEEDENEDSEE